MINQVLARRSPAAWGAFFLRSGGTEPTICPSSVPRRGLRVGALTTALSGRENSAASRHRVTLWLHPRLNVWLWRLEVVNRRDRELPCDAVFIQDLGLGEQGFLMSNEAYASQYLDHFVAGIRAMTRADDPAKSVAGRAYPWTAHGCLEGAAGFATDFRQLMGPGLSRRRTFPAVRMGRVCLRTAFNLRPPCAALQSEA